uniref:Putative ribonuclease H-like domain-containing protein n=1 Tax=Tanacetum cinerariifolium TaxID=118510 RepID=A0A6L2KUM2_TANCI|nr:putative ribonuclease H-like domain-containing protein [Tanacetum cinerariifolium]
MNQQCEHPDKRTICIKRYRGIFCQPPGFEEPDYSDKVYKVVKAFYGLHQALRAWYETLANYLLENGFQRGKFDQTLFIKKQNGDILLVQVYVDDIMFGSTNKKLCKDFERLMKDKFQMSSMGELTFFLGLQVKKKNDGIFISQDKYVAEILRKFGFTYFKSASIPIEIEKPLLKDLDGEDVDVHIYRYLKGKPYLALWYPKDSPFNLVAYSDSDYVGASLDRKSTTGGGQFLDFLNAHTIHYALVINSTIYVSCIKQFWATVSIKKVNDAVQLRTLIDGKKVVVSNDVIRRDLHLDDADGFECLSNEEIFTELARMGYEKPPPKLTFTSCSMASVVICLATGRKFNFSKYISDSMVAELEQDKHAQALEILKLKKRVKKLEKKNKSKSLGGKIEAIDADENITLVDVEIQEEAATMDAEPQGRIDQDDETFFKLNAKKAKILDEQIAQKLHEDEVEKAAARDKQEKDDLERAQVLQKQYDNKEENIDWNAVAEQI